MAKETTDYRAALAFLSPLLPALKAHDRPPHQAFTSGWTTVEGALVRWLETWQGAEEYVALAANNERALRDLLLSFPAGKTALFHFNAPWALPTLEELYDGRLLTPKEATGFGIDRNGGERNGDRSQLYLGRKRGSGNETVAPPMMRPGKADRKQRREETAGATEAAKIENSKDPLLGQLAELANAAGRRARSQFLVEGVLLAQRAIEDGQPIDCLVYTSDLLRAPEGLALLSAAQRAGIRHYQASEGLAGKVTATRPVPDVMAAVWAKFREAESLHTAPNSTLLIAENINNPDNLGMILRTADAGGAEAVIVVGADPFHKNCVRAARGAVGRLPILACSDLRRYLLDLRAAGFTVVGAALGAEAELYRCPLTPPIAVIVGNEQSGITPEILEACSLRVQIPMAPGQDSLNVGVAAGVMLYEVFRQRQTAKS